MNLYQILNLERDASPGEIVAAYRLRAKETHPDAGGDPGEFRKVQVAYETLSDPDRRRRYDETGAYDEGAGLRTRIVNEAVDIFMSVIVNDPPDIAAEIDTRYAKRRKKIGAELERLRAISDLVDRALGRIINAPADDIVSAALEGERAKVRTLIGAQEDLLEVLVAAYKILNGYAFIIKNTDGGSFAESFRSYINAFSGSTNSTNTGG